VIAFILVATLAAPLEVLATDCPAESASFGASLAWDGPDALVGTRREKSGFGYDVSLTARIDLKSCRWVGYEPPPDFCEKWADRNPAATPIAFGPDATLPDAAATRWLTKTVVGSAIDTLPLASETDSRDLVASMYRRDFTIDEEAALKRPAPPFAQRAPPFPGFPVAQRVSVVPDKCKRGETCRSALLFCGVPLSGASQEIGDFDLQWLNSGTCFPQREVQRGRVCRGNTLPPPVVAITERSSRSTRFVEIAGQVFPAGPHGLLVAENGGRWLSLIDWQLGIKCVFETARGDMPLDVSPVRGGVLTSDRDEAEMLERRHFRLFDFAAVARSRCRSGGKVLNREGAIQAAIERQGFGFLGRRLSEAETPSAIARERRRLVAAAGDRARKPEYVLVEFDKVAREHRPAQLLVPNTDAGQLLPEPANLDAWMVLQEGAETLLVLGPFQQTSTPPDWRDTPNRLTEVPLGAAMRGRRAYRLLRLNRELDPTPNHGSSGRLVALLQTHSFSFDHPDEWERELCAARSYILERFSADELEYVLHRRCDEWLRSALNGDDLSRKACLSLAKRPCP
jgi:hypothetical protein